MIHRVQVDDRLHNLTNHWNKRNWPLVWRYELGALFGNILHSSILRLSGIYPCHTILERIGASSGVHLFNMIVGIPSSPEFAHVKYLHLHVSFSTFIYLSSSLNQQLTSVKTVSNLCFSSLLCLHFYIFLKENNGNY